MEIILTAEFFHIAVFPIPHILIHLYVALGFMLADRERLIWDMKIRSSLDCSEHKMVSTGSQPGLLGFFSYMSSKAKTGGKVPLVLNGAEGLMKSTWKMPRYLVLISPHLLLVIPVIRIAGP